MKDLTLNRVLWLLA